MGAGMSVSGLGALSPADPFGLHTAADVHHDRTGPIQAARAATLTAACAARPERFVRKPPAPPELPVTAWINQPAQAEEPLPCPA
jgi:putative transposase